MDGRPPGRPNITHNGNDQGIFNTVDQEVNRVGYCNFIWRSALHLCDPGALIQPRISPSVLNDLPLFDMRQPYNVSRETRYVARPTPVVNSRPL